MKRIVLLLLTASCVQTAQPQNEPAEPPADETVVMAVANDLLGPTTVPIYWYYGQCLQIDGDCDATGMYEYYGEEPIKIVLVYEPYAWQSALAHELVHNYLHRTIGDADDEHHAEVWDWLPQRINTIAAEEEVPK